MKKHLLIFSVLILFSSSCGSGKILKQQLFILENCCFKEVSNLALDGITSYLLIPINNNKYAISTNYALCGVLIDGSFSAEYCFNTINDFYETKQKIFLEQIKDISYFEMVDVELLMSYRSKGADNLVSEMYDENCVLIQQGNLSHLSTKAAALISMGVILVQTDYSDFELSTASCEKYR